MVDFTLLIAIDKQHMEELKFAYFTWIKFKKELRDCPMTIIFDADQISPRCANLAYLQRRDINWIPWTDKENFYRDQREKMLTSFVYVSANEIKTPWYLKLDTDAVATDTTNWINELWFTEKPWEQTTVMPCYIASPWGYTKPATAMQTLDNWADTIPELAKYPRLDLPFDPSQNKICHPRMWSWCMFGNTDFAKRVSSYILDTNVNKYKLPIPSQDTYLSYCRDRLKYPWVRHNFKHSGLAHLSNFKVLKSTAIKLLEE